MLSVVLPIFNEEDNVAAVAAAVGAQLEALGKSYEIIFSDDGSRDGSLDIVRNLSARDPRIKAVRLSRNFGHQVAISAGLEYATGDAVIVMDADLQHPAELIPQLVAQWELGYDVVYTIREGRDHAGPLKRLSAAGFYRLLNRMCDLDINIDANTPDFRLMDRRVVDALLQLPERARFLRGLVRWVGFRQTAVRFTARLRVRGNTKYPFSRMLRFSVDGVTAFSTMPLRFASYLGTVVALSGIPYAAWAVYKRLFTNDAVPGWASLVVAVLVIGGLHLICLGIIGEYVGRVYEEVKGRPLYLTDEVIGDLAISPRSLPRHRPERAAAHSPAAIDILEPTFAQRYLDEATRRYR
jgi:dolichol-phosphate mannosyltransferase